jgi:aldose 1-epimerase
MNSENFGLTADNESIQRFTLSGGGLCAKFINWGAVLQDLRFEGESNSLVLGLENLEDYLKHSRYFGATAGPYANRIDRGQFRINEKEVQLQKNFQNQHHLHGGTEGIGKRAWKLEDFKKDSLKLSIIHPDKHMGFPGPIKIHARFTLSVPGILDILYSAETERPTIVNLAHHSYFNLSGEKTILDHELRVNASTYLEVDSGLIPRGAPQSVDDGVHDFQDFRPIQSVTSSPSKLDHNFCLSLKPQEIRPVAWLKSKGVCMQINTTEPGLQVYDGHGLDVPIHGTDEKFMGAYAGIALEPQLWPDSPNRSDFAQPFLLPGEIYSQHTQYIFSKID